MHGIFQSGKLLPNASRTVHMAVLTFLNLITDIRFLAGKRPTVHIAVT